MLVAIFALAVVSCETTTTTVLPESGAAPSRLTLAPGDTIKLTFPGTPELNQTQKIRSDGKVNLPLIGEVEAAHKSVPAFQSELTASYKSQLKDNVVIVTVESSVIQVIISGAVSKPAKLIFERPTTVFQAVMEAGGVTEYGSLRRVHLVRLVAGQQRTQVLDLSTTLTGQNTHPYYVRDGDVIVVPQSLF